MDGGYNGKRLYEGDLVDCNRSRQKRRNQGNNNNHNNNYNNNNTNNNYNYNNTKDLGSGSFMPYNLPLSLVQVTIPDDAVFRILCPAPKIGSVIGKGGNIIKSLRQESGAKIKIADAIPGVDERVIIISVATTRGSNDRSRGNNKTGTGAANNANRTESRIVGSRDRDMNNKEKDNNSNSKDAGNHNSKKLTPTQDALFKVHTCIVADMESFGGGGGGGGEQAEEQEPRQEIVTRLLVPNNQIGCLLGKGGKIIEQMRESTGAQIRILPKDQLPGCALPTDELVQIFGDIAVSKKALTAVSSRLQENPPRNQSQPFPSPLPLGSNFAPMNDYLQKDLFYKDSFYNNKSNGPMFGLGLDPLDGGGWSFGGRNLPLPLEQQLDNNNKRNKEGRNSKRNELVFRLLCPSDKIGSVIGKGGSIIHNLRKETGARIKIADAVHGSDERIIIVSADELPGDTFSPALEAVIQVQSRTTTKMGGDKDGIVTTRLLVPTNQIGCLLGKGGSIIAEMRRTTRANICILPKDTLPRCAQETDELVQEMQIVGDMDVAREALFQIITKLRNNAFRESGGKVGRGNGGGHEVGLSLPPPNMLGENYNNSYNFNGRMEPISPNGGVYTLPRMGLTGALHTSSSFGSLGTPSDAWGIEGGGGLSSLSGFGGGPSHLIQPLAGVYGGGGSRAIGNHATNLGTISTVEVHIPNTSVGSVIGKGGSNIAHIRQISGAKLKLHNSEQGAKDRVLELCGTLEQTRTAQSLVQAYMQSSMGGNGLFSSSRFST